MISTLYNMLGWIFIVLAHWKNILRVDLLLLLDTLSWFRNQPVFVLTPSCCVFSGAAANFNCIVFALVSHDWGSNQRCTTLKVSMLSITLRRWLYLKWNILMEWRFSSVLMKNLGYMVCKPLCSKGWNKLHWEKFKSPFKTRNGNAVVLGMKQTVIRIFNFTLRNDPVSIGFKFWEIKI